MVQGNDFDTKICQGINKKQSVYQKHEFSHFYLTEKLYAFDLNTYDGSPDEVNVGCRVVP